MNKSLCLVGTDTEVGKSYVAALLLDYLQQQGGQPGYLKLVSCGGEEPPDCEHCQQVAGLNDEQIRCLYHFPMAASPHLAAAAQGAVIDPAVLSQGLAQARSDFGWLIVEGAGGLLVPLQHELLLADFLASQQLELVLVARSGLGTLNHTLLSIEAIRQRGLSLAGVIFSDEQPYEPDDRLVNDNMTTIAALAKVKVLGRLPRCQQLSQARKEMAAIAAGLFRARGWL